MNIKVEETDVDDYESTTSVQRRTIDGQCLPCSGLDSNTRIIKLEVDHDDTETKRDFPSPVSFERLKTECYQDGEDGSANKAISLSIVITIPNISNPSKCLTGKGPFTTNKDIRIDGCETTLPSLQQGGQEPSYQSIRTRKRSCSDKDGKDLKKARCSNENKVDIGIRRNTARSKRNNYKKAEGSDDDGCLYCKECQAFSRRECSTHGPMVPREDACNKNVSCKAMQSLPPNCSIKESCIPEAGLGVFALQEIPIGTRFGPHKGKKVVKGAVNEFTDTSSMWEIMKDRKISHYVDGKMDSENNWMRYINCARTEAEQNLIVFQYENEIYYQAEKTIKINDELLVWYGDEYTSGLGKVWDDLDSEDTSCRESTLSNESIGNSQQGSKNKLKIDHISCSIVKCQSCRKTCSGRFISKENYESLEFVCKSCSGMKNQKSNSDCFSDVTGNAEGTDLASQLVVPTITEKCDSTKNVKAVKESRAIYLECKTSTSERMVSESSSEDVTTPKHANSHTSKGTSASMIESGSNNVHQKDNTRGKQCRREIHQSSDRQLNFKRYVRTQSSQKIHKCKLCQFVSTKLDVLKGHMRTHTGEKPYKCEICQSAFRQKKVLTGHMRTHTGEKPYKCEICQSAFRQKKVLKRHMRTHTGEKPYKCEICQYSSSQLSNLKTHLITHSGEKPYHCEICQYACIRLGSLKTHMRTHTGEKPYKCEICQSAFRGKSVLKGHMRIHTDEKPYKCEICQYSSSQLSHLKRHLITHNGEKPYKCELCQYACIRLDTLKTHMRTHTGEKPYKCEICQSAFSHPCSLKVHMRIHSGEKPYKCNICQSALSRLYTLKRHLRTHSGEKPYKCEICKYACIRLGTLQAHMRTHTGEKPYKCEICQYSSSHLGTLKRHLRTHSGKKPYKCEVSQYASSQ